MTNQPISLENQTFFDKILTEAGIENLSPSLREKMYEDLSSRLESWLFLETKKHLSKRDLEGLEQLVAKEAAPEEIQKFFLNHIADYQNIVAQAMLDFKDAFLRGVAKGKKN